MKATDLFKLAPLGALVTYRDGTPVPPAHHKRKLRDWNSRNSYGYFVMARKGDPAKEHDPPRFVLQQDRGTVVINLMFGLSTDREFTVELPKPGTILAYRKFQDEIEVCRVWPDLAAAQSWACGYMREGKPDYRFAKCGYDFFIVNGDGSLLDYMPEDLYP